jgi:hypothetical protein
LSIENLSLVIEEMPGTRAEFFNKKPPIFNVQCSMFNETASGPFTEKA